MFGGKRTHGIAALLTVVAALTFLAGSAQAANSRPAGMTKAEYRALMLRGEALNERYGLGAQVYQQMRHSNTELALKADGLRLQAMARAYEQRRPAASFYTRQALRAEGLRWQAMARAYQQQRPPVVTVSHSSGFDWGDAGIGAAGGLGLAICAAAVILMARRIRRTNLAL